jgi:hypothetical protein
LVPPVIAIVGMITKSVFGFFLVLPILICIEIGQAVNAALTQRAALE